MKIRFQESGVFPQGMAPSDEVRLLQLIEICGRTAYKSEDKITDRFRQSFCTHAKKSWPPFRPRTQQYRSQNRSSTR